MGTFARYSRRNERERTKLKKLFDQRMNTIFGIFVVLAAFTWASADKRDAAKVVDLAEELAKSREETKELIRRENEQLKKEAGKLREEDDKLREENQRLQREIRELRHADAEIKQSIRQRDQNETRKLQNIVKNSFRQKRVTSELKRTINNQIIAFLQTNKICVAGNFTRKPGDDRSDTIDFGHTFPRIPAFTASINGFGLNTYTVKRGGYVYVYAGRPKVTKSSAVIWMNSADFDKVNVSWMACL